MSKNLQSLRGGCAELLAAAVLDLFPQAYLKGGSPTNWGFYYDFLFEASVTKESLVLIEERMRQNSKKKEDFYVMEMMPKNAQDYFKSLGREDLQDRNLRLEEPLSRVVKIDEFLDLCDFALPKKTSDISQFKILEALPIEGGVRILGTAFFEKVELKNFVKEWEEIGNRDYHRWAKDLDLIQKEELGWVWLPRGEALKEILIDIWKKELAKENFQFISTGSFNLEELFQTHINLIQERSIKTAEITFLPLAGEGEEGLLDLPQGFVDRAFIPFKKEELLSELISSLQFIVKILKMFSFEYEVVLRSKGTGPMQEALKKNGLEARVEKGSGSSIEFYLSDLLGRKWLGPSLTIHLDKPMLVVSVFSSLERFVALLLEKYQGEIPLWMAPEQVRVIGFNKKQVEKVALALREKKFRVGIDFRQEILSKKVHESLRERVPYSIVLGDRELESQTLSVRAYGTKVPEQMKIETLISRLEKELESQ